AVLRITWRIWWYMARCIWPAMTIITRARRGGWSWQRRASFTGWAFPTRGSAHERKWLPRIAAGSAAPDAWPSAGAFTARVDRRAGARGGGRAGDRRRTAGAGSTGARIDRQRAAVARDHCGRRDGATRGHRGDAGGRDAGAGAAADPCRGSLAA